jgi:hypothetical protein
MLALLPQTRPAKLDVFYYASCGMPGMRRWRTGPSRLILGYPYRSEITSATRLLKLPFFSTMRSFPGLFIFLN